jgi:hypothetical protein
MMSLDLWAILFFVAFMLLIAVFAVFIAWVTALVIRGDQRGFLLDAALAPVAFLVAYAVLMTLRNPSTQAMYPDSYPWPWDLVVAWVLPVLHQIYRRRRQDPP